MEAFVIMPFGGDFDEVFTDLIEPALAELGFKVTRADLSNNQEQILKDIVNMIASAELIIADVTGLNGNVMYELGLAHAMGRKTAIITRNIDELPFDLRSYRVTSYKTTFTAAPALAKRLKEIGQGVIDGTATFGNPVQDFAPASIGRDERVSEAPAAPATSGSSESSPGTDSAADFGLLDWTDAVTRASDRVKEKADLIGEATFDIGERAEKATKRMNSATEQLGASAAPTLLRLMKETAAEFDNYAEKLERLNPELADAVKELGDGTNGIARSRRATTDQERAIMRTEVADLRDAEATFETAVNSVMEFGLIVADLPPVQQDMTRAGRRVTNAIGETAQIIETCRSEIARARTLLEARLGEDDDSTPAAA
ncbi:hypothetical protein [Curtobacterium pusillum]|uniref:hypothetical protein n=1 Tax=Curtobacterium pusillum TaxID=69373 RepID=UPI0011A77FA8|nr:hypothetical protein [Curtobacterium pusillum]